MNLDGGNAMIANNVTPAEEALIVSALIFMKAYRIEKDRVMGAVLSTLGKCASLAGIELDLSRECVCIRDIDAVLNNGKVTYYKSSTSGVIH
jgi:hypothetical protein